MAVRPDIAFQTQSINPVAALDGGQVAAERLKTQGIREAMLNQQAANTVLESELLNRSVAQSDIQIENALAKQTQAQSLVLNKLLKQIKAAPVSQRAGIAARSIPALEGFGIGAEQIGQLDVSDQGLDEAIASTNAFITQSETTAAGKDFRILHGYC